MAEYWEVKIKKIENATAIEFQTAINEELLSDPKLEPISVQFHDHISLGIATFKRKVGC